MNRGETGGGAGSPNVDYLVLINWFYQRARDLVPIIHGLWFHLPAALPPGGKFHCGARLWI